MPRQTYKWEPKDPEELLIRTHDWTPRLEPGEVITDSWAAVDAGDVSGVTIEGQLMVGNIQQVTLSGGTVDTDVKLTLRIEINGGEQIFDAGIWFPIVQW